MEPGATDIESLRAALEARQEVAFAYLFGSASSGRRHGQSDVDVAVWVYPDALEAGEGRNIGTDLWIDLWGVAERSLPGQQVDVVLLHRAPPLLADRVVRFGKVLFSRDEQRRIQWVVETKARYCDLKPLHRMLDAVVTDRVRTGRFGKTYD